MATYNTDISRTASTGDPLVPDPIVLDVIKQLPEQSVALQKFRSTTMSALTDRQPVVDVLPIAYFAGGDTGLGQTTNEIWGNVFLQAEKLISLVPVPTDYIDDSGIPIWDEVRPAMVEAIGAVIDGACLFGVNKPASWTSPDVFSHALAAGNIVSAASDPGVEIAGLGRVVSQDGFAVNGFVSTPGFPWELSAYRGANGQPVYVPNMADSGPTGYLYGQPLAECRNGAWDATKATVIGGDWSKGIIGIRKDVTFDVTTEGVIVDGTGKVIFSAFQQDIAILKVTMRVAYALANPVTRLNGNATTRSPFAVMSPNSGYAS